MSVFNDDNNSPPEKFLDTLVGEGKKFSDPEALARGKWEADNHIARLQEELAALRNDKTVEEKVAELLGRQNEPNPNPNGNAAPNPPANPQGPAKEIDLAEEVRKIIAAEDQNKAVKNNVETVAAKLIELYGDEAKANQIVKTRAQELGVSVEFLQSVAAQSPKAFFATTGLNADATPNGGPTHGNVNPAALANSPSIVKPNTYKWYQQLRKDNPKAYAKMSMQMHNDAIKMGSDFYT